MRLVKASSLLGVILTITVSTGYASPFAGLITSHPRVFATDADLRALKASIPIQQSFPTKGEVTFTIKPAAKAEGDGSDSVVFGKYSTDKNHIPNQNNIFVRHIDTLDNGEKINFRVGLTKAGSGNNAAGHELWLDANKETTVVITYDGQTNLATIKIGEEPAKRFNTIRPELLNGWVPSPDGQAMSPRKNEVVKDIIVRNSVDKKIEWKLANVENGLYRSYLALLNSSRTISSKIAECDSSTMPAAYCNVGTAPASAVVGEIKNLALAYQLTKDQTFLAAAESYANRIIALKNVGEGKEFAVTARVNALGIIYDWFNDALGQPLKEKIHQAIKETVGFDTSADDEIIDLVCGSNNFNGITYDCIEDPVGISRYYISGHHASANNAVAVGLLAIAEDSNSIFMPLLSRIYGHMEGMIRARDYVSIDGGFQTLFGYNMTAGDMIERTIMWRRALGTPDLLPTVFESNSVLPYIYGLRGNNSFPVSGDRVEDASLAAANLGSMALAAAALGNAEAEAFYNSQILPARAIDSPQAIWNKLNFPVAIGDKSDLSHLSLSTHFRRSGNVLMRDKWEFDKATLVDFKSTSFISENHHHLDQNSFSVFKHAPLLVDSGAYDTYESVHWKNYYQRSVAHNTIVVFDPTERFGTDTAPLSNDGGQWYGNRHRYPTLDEITAPNGTHVLDGIIHYQEHEKGHYTFATGDATRAYANKKLAASEGFLRSIFYLRPAAFGFPVDDLGAATNDPVVVVFDRVRTNKGLTARSLLHSVRRPITSATLTNQGTCHYELGKSTDNAPLTIRNDGGMVRVEPLLPKNAKIHLVGSDGGSYIKQQLGEKDETTRNDFDCRFPVPDSTATVWWDGGPSGVNWSNYPHKDKIVHNSDDNGGWRIEIAPRTVEDQQLFLNVLHVASNDQGTSSPSTHTAILLADGKTANTVAVSIHGTTIAFPTVSSAPSLYWEQKSVGRIIAAGLEPNSRFNLTVNGNQVSIVKSANGTLPSSKDGVVDTAVQ